MRHSFLSDEVFYEQNVCERLELRLINLWHLAWTPSKLKFGEMAHDMVSHHDIEYNFVFRPAASKARFASLARFWHTRARLCINQLTKIAWACAACCLDTVFNPGIAVHFLYSGLTGYDHQFVNLWNGCSHSEYQFDERKQDWQVRRNFPPHWGCSFNRLCSQLY